MDKKKFDTKELQFPETLFIRDIENKVFQSIVLQCLAEIDGISLIEGTFFDSILGRNGSETAKGIHAEQDHKNRSVNIKLEVNVCYGTPIPAKAEEIQAKIAKEVTNMTGLHVATVHVIFKNVIPAEEIKKAVHPTQIAKKSLTTIDEGQHDEF